ncbi:MAG: terpene cyclase/mutase family protein [Bryobacterales bacterium]|nr:terpene cyclase/mutase family protein [Bryobacterales bacterium]
MGNHSAIRVFGFGVAAMALVSLHANSSSNTNRTPAPAPSVERGIKWLASVQGRDGGWGQDGGETSYVRQGENLERGGNDVANTAVAVLALRQAGSTPKSGPYKENVRRGVEFLLRSVEQSPRQGLAITDITGTQIQRKLGPYIDTFLTSKLLAELDGQMESPAANARVRRALEKCVAKVQANQLKDGSWNVSGGWAPILGTSIASQSLAVARDKGVKVDQVAMARVDDYTRRTAAEPVGVAGGVPGDVRRGGVIGGIIGGVPSAAPPPAVAASAAGVPLYKRAQELEQMSRTAEDRRKNAKEIKAIERDLGNAQFVTGFGSMGGEELFSYLNISDSLRRTGGPAWDKWRKETFARVEGMQNGDGTWAGHHCITGRVAVTSAAVLILAGDPR